VTDIFLSYNREDQAQARLFAEAFEAQGFKVWWDVGLRTGEAYDEVTETALRTAKAVVVLWSKKSVVSRWVRAEATLADRNKTLVPCMIEPCERPIMFELTQTAELSHWRGDQQDRGWQTFLADVRGFVTGEAQPAHPRAPAPPPPVAHALAVLPFDNLSTDADMQFFSDGVSEEIIQRLSRGAQMKVIGRTSSFQFRGERKADAAAALRCSHVLDGSIRRAGGRVRVAAHLVEAASHVTLWSDRFDRTLEDIFAVQDEISEHIAAALHRTFTSFSTRSVDSDVYDLYLRAAMVSQSPDELRRCITLLESATHRAPDFAEAWGRLAYARAFLLMYTPYADRAAGAGLVRTAADRAMAIDEGSAEAALALLLVLPTYGAFLPGGEAAERMRRTPSTGGEMFISRFLRSVGRVRDGAEVSERAYHLNTLDPLFANLYALAIMSRGRVAETVPILEGLVARVPDMSFAVANLMRAYAFLGAWARIDQLLDPAANRPLREFEEGLAFINAKRRPTPENLAKIRDGLTARVADTGCIDISRLVYAAHLGLVDEAYAAADGAHLGPRGNATDLMGPDAYATGMLFWEIMPEIRRDRRFVKLCARLGLVE